MKYEDNKVTDIRIAYIGGGSRGWAWSFMTDLSMEASISGTIRLYDIDEAAAKNNEIIGNHLNQRPDTMGKWNYVTCKTLEEALTGCDFVVISILPGTFDEMSSDVHLPERLGIYQSVGDTAGPGGMIRALRTIPVMADFARDMEEVCPDAWFLNYTNPMAMLSGYMQRYTNVKTVGLCHSVQVCSEGLLKGLGMEDKLEGRKELIAGINHMAWLLEIYDKDGNELEKQDMGGSKYKMRPNTYFYNPADGDPSTWVNGKPPAPEQPSTPEAPANPDTPEAPDPATPEPEEPDVTVPPPGVELDLNPI